MGLHMTGSTVTQLNNVYAAKARTGTRAVGQDELYYNVLDHGIVGDGSNESTVLQACADAAAAAGKILYAPPGVTIKIGSTLTITGHCHMPGATLTTSAALAPAVEVRAAAGGGARVSNLMLRLPDVTQTAQVWTPGALPTGANGFASLDTGVRLTNVLSSIIHVGTITGFSVGLYCYARGTSGFNSYNEIHPGALINNKVNLLIGTDNASTTNPAACNESTWLGGRLAHYGPPTNLTNTTGTRQILIDAAASAVDGHHFLGTSIEGDAPEYHIESFGTYIEYIGLRYDTSAETPKYLRNAKVVTCADASVTANIAARNDIFLGGYNLSALVITDTSGGSGRVQIDSLQLRVGQITTTSASGINASGGPIFANRVQAAIATQTLAANGAVTIDASKSTATITLQANATSSTITNPPSSGFGERLLIRWKQDATGGRTYVWPTTCKFAGGSAPSDTTASKSTSVLFEYDGTNWNEIGRAVAVG